MKYFRYHELPHHEHDCLSCKFMVSIEDDNRNFIDVYKNCDNSHFPYIIRYGPEGDYATVDLNTLFISYAIAHFNEWK